VNSASGEERLLWFAAGYARPDFLEAKRGAEHLARRLYAATEVNSAVAVVRAWNQQRSWLLTQQSYARAHYDFDTSANHAREEWRWWNQSSGVVQELDAIHARAVIDCAMSGALGQSLGAQFVELKRCTAQRSSPLLAPHLEEEGAVIARHRELCARRDFTVAGVVHNALSVRALFDSPDPEVRLSAWLARERFCEAHFAELDSLFDRLLSARRRMAEALGHRCYVPLGYSFTERIGYLPNQVLRFAKAVRAEYAPLAHALLARKARSLGLPSLQIQDERAPDATLQCRVVVEPRYWVATLTEVLHAAHPAFGEFMAEMAARRMFDLEPRGGKVAHAQCSFFAADRMPFVSAQLAGRPHDLATLIHELGHAFQGFRGRNAELVEYIWPTSDGCELAAVSLSLLCLPAGARFFGDTAHGHERDTFERMVFSAPLCTLMDRFQHEVYTRSELTAPERRALWASLEREFMPWRQYPRSLPQLAAGAGYLLIPHLFMPGFYGLHYTLADVAALEFHRRAQCDPSRAWSDYVALCDLGGSRSFPEMLDHANLSSPFDPATIRTTAEYLRSRLGLAQHSP
jgi:M3 family oligoendopeptidase